VSKSFIKITDNGLEGYDKNGDLRLAANKGLTQFTAPAIQLGPENPGRIYSGNNQMNPLGQHLPSDIVTPLPTWIEVPPEMSIAMTMIMAIASVIESLEEDSSGGTVLGKPKIKSNYQILNFDDFLPESIGD